MTMVRTMNTLAVVVEYPFHMLPKKARGLTNEETELLQSSFAWMQTYGGRIPHMTAKSYSELWLLVQNLGHMQANVRFTKITHLSQWTTPHEARYAATEPKHSFCEILYYDFSLLEEVLFDCAEFEAQA